MISYTVFDESTGKIIQNGYCQDDQINKQSEIYSITEGFYDGGEFYWENGSFVKIPESPGNYYEFNYETKTWVYNDTRAKYDALAKRDKMLAEGPDRISPMWWSSMTPEEQQAWTFYRQALLDITEQADYPEFIVWPIKP